MKRYTGKNLEAALPGMNALLARTGDPYIFVIGYRYNYTAVDLATPENAARHCTNKNLECGTPRECLAACNAYVASATANFLARSAAPVAAPAFINIPAVGECPAYAVDPLNKAHLSGLIARADAYFELSKQAWEARQDGRLTPERYAELEQRETTLAANGEALLKPFGIKCDWPGLYPTFEVLGFTEYKTSAAILAALKHPRNFLAS